MVWLARSLKYSIDLAQTDGNDLSRETHPVLLSTVRHNSSESRTTGWKVAVKSDSVTKGLAVVLAAFF